MTASARKTAPAGPPFRAEHVGSFLRPEALLNAVRRWRKGEIDAAALSAAQDRAIAEVVRLQESLGLASVTDGEFRRRAWSAGFIDAVAGFGLREGALSFRTAATSLGAAPAPYAKARLERKAGIATAEFRHLKSVVRAGMPKITLPAPDVMHYFLGPASFDARVYADADAYFDDLMAIYRAEIAELGALGCRYLQLDDTALACHCDPAARAAVQARGEDPVALAERYVALLNRAIADRPAGMSVAVHLCRGNLKGAWMAEGGYEPVAEALFGGAEVAGFLLEYDTDRAGDFAPLRHLPAPKIAVLGLISTKTPTLETVDELRRRIDAAARYVPLERLALAPQCGFSSVAGADQPITEDDQRRKIERLIETAHAVWG